MQRQLHVPATDRRRRSNVATVTIAVAPVNDAPVRTTIPTRRRGTPPARRRARRARQRWRHGGDALTGTLVEVRPFGALSLNADALSATRPPPIPSGIDSFQYAAARQPGLEPGHRDDPGHPVTTRPWRSDDSYTPTGHSTHVPAARRARKRRRTRRSFADCRARRRSANGTLVLVTGRLLTYTPNAGFAGPTASPTRQATARRSPLRRR